MFERFLEQRALQNINPRLAWVIGESYLEEKRI